MQNQWRMSNDIFIDKKPSSLSISSWVILFHIPNLVLHLLFIIYPLVILLLFPNHLSVMPQSYINHISIL